ncbi:MAG: endonuclease NucS [Candidatus Bathyarchaeota archaeon]|jgi:hypothetical protein
MSIEKVSVKSKEELVEMISKEVNQIEQGLTMICNHVSITDSTVLDIMCHDSNGQIVVIQLNIEEDDRMLLKGIHSLDYVDKFRPFLKATYSSHKIDDKEKPRLILVAPSYSETLRHAVEHLQGIRVDLYEWEYLKIGDHKGLRLQPIFARKPQETFKKPVEMPKEVPKEVPKKVSKEVPKEVPEKEEVTKPPEKKTQIDFEKKDKPIEKKEKSEPIFPKEEENTDFFPSWKEPSKKKDEPIKEEPKQKSDKKQQKRKLKLF